MTFVKQTDPAQAAREAEALRLFDGDGCVRLFDADLTAGSLTLERAVPGTPLSEVADEVTRTTVIAGVLRRMWRPAPDDVALPSLAELGSVFEWYDAQYPSGGPVPGLLRAAAGAELADLLVSEERTVLHGDLHHSNVLRAEREPWLAIDPHGWVGDRTFDTAQCLTNPLDEIRDAKRIESMLHLRVDVLTGQLDLDRDRVLAWGFVKAIVSTVWFLQDGETPHPAFARVAHVLFDWLH